MKHFNLLVYITAYTEVGLDHLILDLTFEISSAVESLVWYIEGV